MWTWLSRAAQPIMPYIMVAALATLFGLVAVIRYQSNQLSTLQQHQGALVLSLTQTSQSYFDLKQLAADNQQAQAELRAKLAAVSSTSQYRKNKIEELKRELSDVKAWADAQLPDAIRRLHQRPAISGSAEYRRWLSARDPVPVTREQPHQQSGDQQ